MDTYEFFNDTSSDSGFEGFWTYGKERLNEGKSNVALAVVPAEFFEEC